MKRRYALLLLFAVLIGCFAGCGNVSVNVLDDRAEYRSYKDYGVINKTGCDEKIREMFSASFPDRLVKTYQNSDYRFFGQRDGACEIYLEFSIPQESEFYEYTDRFAPLDAFSPFPFRDGWLEYDFCAPSFYVDAQASTLEEIRIHDSAIEKMLIEPETHTVIHWLLYAGQTSVPVTELHKFFDRFGLAPWDYEYQLFHLTQSSDVSEYSSVRFADDTVFNVTAAGESAASESSAQAVYEKIFPQTLPGDFMLTQFCVVRTRNGEPAEVFLQYRIPDEAAFRKYCSQYRKLGTPAPFYYDTAWEDVSVLRSVCAIDYPGTGFGLYRSLTVGKILINAETQTVVHWLILGGGDTTDRMGDYHIGFDFFKIEPSDFSYRISTAEIT